MALSLEDFTDVVGKIKKEVSKVIVGYDEIIDLTIIALLSGGHVLLEGVPGIGKTLLVKTLSEILNLKFSRIQFTPDLMPADITGTNIIVEDESGRKHFRFQEGPIFANIILADEINRATPKTQSALLEAMQEGSVTSGGNIYLLPKPFFVMATQNPIEMEGTYPLPEAQLDRFFFKLILTPPGEEELLEIIERTTNVEIPKVEKVADGNTIEALKQLVRSVPISTAVKEYAVRIVLATHPESKYATEKVKKYVKYGSSPRGAQALILGAKALSLFENRANVSFKDIKKVAIPSLRHRIILSFEGEAEGITPDEIIQNILEEIKEY
ncbi:MULTISPECIES: AAA family ATPase [Dictyoglomus]|uniref:ATPase associated with various cellular activities AAA_3 n=1 Tax=Dictyoglomus turgidum (strain DSM 6724 / Z-1310) TaxID=515635 RepID=B8E1N7_DICTD|nr:MULTISPECIES: MoxR family ATPase [Dictyoglomus]ACK41562.1 ATPase associated with various cellular activities AAA_3 [Dictyoglomus turgidum DSM 6724]HBU31722.1 MoxR family ATPase [Dictyoglomus sp.]